MSGSAVPGSDASPGEEGATESLSALLALLDLETIDTNVFRGVSPKDRWQRVFGGQVLGQALVAASRTVEGRECHSLHAYFLRAGDPKIPILYEVDRSRDGLSFSARRVVAVQHGEPIFTMSASFEVPETGLEHQIAMPNSPIFPSMRAAGSCASGRLRSDPSSRPTVSQEASTRHVRSSGSAPAVRYLRCLHYTNACSPTLPT